MQKKRTAADIMRTILWYYVFSTITGQDAPIKLARLIMPNTSFKERLKAVAHILAYTRKGAHTPRPDLVQTVELFAPGTSYIINMPLWSAFGPSFTISSVPFILNRLPSNILSAAKVEPRSPIENSTSLKYGKGYGQKLVRIGTFDALCMLIVFWQIDMIDQKHPNRESIAFDIYHVLLILAAELSHYGCCEQFFLFLKNQVFDYANFEGYRFNLDYEKFKNDTATLNIIYPFDHQCGAKLKIKRNAAVGIMLQRPSKFFELHLILNGILKFDELASTPGTDLFFKRTYQQLTTEWAYNTLFQRQSTTLTSTIDTYAIENSNLTSREKTLLILKAQANSLRKNV